MKIAACINAWGDTLELLPHCINNIAPVVDMVIVLWSEKSNYGVSDPRMQAFANEFKKEKVIFARCEPVLNYGPPINETEKRNHGLRIAKGLACTHFLSMDADEFYIQEEFLKDKERFLNPNLKGLVARTQVYFKSPKLTIGLDTTLVSYIHKLTNDLQFNFNKSYPFTWNKNQLLIDPTRQLNINDGVEMTDTIMHHYSYVRKDLEKKIENSTARGNIRRSTIRQDFALAKEGGYCNFYGKKLIRASVDFNLPELDVHEDLQSLSPTNGKKSSNT